MIVPRKSETRQGGGNPGLLPERQTTDLYRLSPILVGIGLDLSDVYRYAPYRRSVQLFTVATTN